MREAIYKELIQGVRSKSIRKQLIAQKDALTESDYFALSALLNSMVKDITEAREDLMRVELSTIDFTTRRIALEADLQIYLFEGKNLEVVRDKIESILKLDPDSIFALDALAQIEFSDGNEEKGFELLHHIHRENPDTSWVNKRMAEYLIWGSRYYDASPFIAKIDDAVTRSVYATYVKFYFPYRLFIQIAIVILLVIPQTQVFTFLLILLLLLPAYVYLKYRRDRVFPRFLRNSILKVTIMFTIAFIREPLQSIGQNLFGMAFDR